MERKVKAVHVFSPASIGNVGLGFDLLGAAVKPIEGEALGDSVAIVPAAAYSLSVTGRFAHKLPVDTNQNIVTHCYHFFNQAMQQRGLTTEPLALTLNKHLPIGSGLGSSAASIVATFSALNLAYQQPFNQGELLLMMGELEGQISGSIHYDNVAPAYLGGLTLTTDQAESPVLRLPCFDNWYWVLCYSGISVSTSEARAILPAQVTLADTLRFGRQLAVFVDAIHRKEEQLAASMINDVIAEPYRKSLLPGFDQAKNFVKQQGALAFGISGSGPTVFAVTNKLEQAQRIHALLQKHYIQNQDGFCHICKLDNQGTVAL